MKLEPPDSLSGRLLAALDEHAIVSVADAQGGIEYVNRKFCEISGYAAEELIGMNHRLLKSGLHAADFYEEMWRCIAGGRTWRGEVCNRRKTGELYWVVATIMPELDSAGLPCRYVSICTDISATKSAQWRAEAAEERYRRSQETERQQELQLALDEARRANRAKADFMSRMSHELRTPLNAVLGFSQVLLLDRNLDAEQKDPVSEILKAGKHLLELVDEVLDIARIDLGTLQVSLQPVRLGEVIHEAMALVTSVAHERGISVEHDIDTAIAVAADPLRLKQCLINLLSNAVKYNRSGGAVRVRAGEQGQGRVRIEVEDSGAGLDAGEMEQLFQPFARLERHRENVQGIGIGLSITQRLVKLMNGEIGVHSRQGVGSVFWIELERAEPGAGVGGGGAGGYAGHALSSPVRGAARKQVLYVEDNPANLKLVRSMLGLLPTVAVLTASTAAEGMTLARDGRPDLILLDIALPGMTCFELLAWLRREPALAGIPVIAISANAMPADVQGGLAAGFDDYLTKPIDVHELLSRVQAALARQAGRS